MIGAAMPQECAAAILGAANGSTVAEAQLPERFGWALQVGRNAVGAPLARVTGRCGGSYTAISWQNVRHSC